MVLITHRIGDLEILIIIGGKIIYITHRIGDLETLL